MAVHRIEKLVNRLLPELYGTVEDEAAWTGVLDNICAELELRSAVAMVTETDRAGAQNHWIKRDSFSLRHAALHDRMINNGDNPRVPTRPLSSLPAGGMIQLDEDIFDRDSVPGRAFVARLEQCHLGPAAWVGIPVDANRCFTLILHRQPRDVSASEKEREFLDLMRAHLQRLIRLTAPADRTARDALEQTFDCLRIGLLLLDENLAIHHMNRAADRIIAGSSFLSVVGGRLRARRPQDRERLASLARHPHAAALSSGGLCVFKEDEGQELEMRAVPLRRHAPRAGPALALFIQEPGRLDAPEAAEIMALCGLSPAEARLAAMLTEGLSVSEFATERGIQEGTARIQLKHALAKTRCSRQSALVGRVLRSVAAQTDPASA